MLARAALALAVLLAGCAAGSPSPSALATGLGDAAELDGAQPLDAGAESSDAPLPLGKVNAEADASAGPAEAAIADEPPYLAGNRWRSKSAAAASGTDEAIAKWNRGGGAEAPAGPSAKVPHPAPRIKVDVLKVQGHTKEADVLRVARAQGYWPFRRCYEEGLRRQPKLRGTIRMRLVVGASGAPRSVTKVGAELDDAAVVSCVLRAGRSLALPRPDRGAPEVTLEVSLLPGDVPLDASSAPKNLVAYLELPELVASLREHWPEVRACFVAALGRHPGLWGRLALRLRIKGGGRVVEVSEVESRFSDPEVTQCAIKAFSHADLPAPLQEVVLVYPLRLGSAPDAGR
jgi:hypothetical protein